MWGETERAQERGDREKERTKGKHTEQKREGMRAQERPSGSYLMNKIWNFWTVLRKSISQRMPQ